MKRFVSLGIGFAVVFTAAALTVDPASALGHHHRHHRNHHRGVGPVCGPETTLSGGACVATTPDGPVGNFVFTPSSITMDLRGNFAVTAVISGLPPLGSLSLGNQSTAFFAACGAGSQISIGSADALGRLQLRISGNGCVPGTYPVALSETTSPFQTFIGFFTLHF